MRNALVSFFIAIVVVGTAGLYLHEHPNVLTAGSTSTTAESPYDRVIRTGEIHCGYTSWDPLFFVDSKTGEKTGIFYDLMEEAGKRLGLKIIWQEELGWGTVVESIKSGRVDMACAGYWLNPPRIKNVSSSAPQLYAPLYIWVRHDDMRPKTPEDLNSDQYTVVTADGGAINEMLAHRFPKSKVMSLSEMISNSELIESITTGKSDFTVADAPTMAVYQAHNPGKIRNAFPDQPMVVFPIVMLLPPADPRFKHMIDNILQNIEFDGTFDAILKKYKMENGFLRNPKPVRLSP